MILVVSDLHLGKDEATDDESLRELASCIRSNSAEHIVFLGDVFDAFIDSGSTPPDAVAKWSDMVRLLRSDDLTVSYVMGNHDRWHRNYVRDLTGAAPVRHHIELKHGGHRIWLEHGDGAPVHGSSTSFARWLSDQPFMYRLYTTLLPFGGAQSLAAAVSKRFSSFEPSPAAVAALKGYAEQIVADQQVDGVLMGHCHQPGVFDLTDIRPGAWYMNTGDWYGHRSFILLEDGDKASAKLCAWNEGATLELDVIALS